MNRSYQTPINMITPAQLNENILFDTNTYILDIRFWYDRKLVKGLPSSHEASFISIRKYVNQIPKDKNILVICQGVQLTNCSLLPQIEKFQKCQFPPDRAGWLEILAE